MTTTTRKTQTITAASIWLGDTLILPNDRPMRVGLISYPTADTIQVSDISRDIVLTRTDAVQVIR